MPAGLNRGDRNALAEKQIKRSREDLLPYVTFTPFQSVHVRRASSLGVRFRRSERPVIPREVITEF
jgi:hypothetical protein